MATDDFSLLNENSAFLGYIRNSWQGLSLATHTTKFPDIASINQILVDVSLLVAG